MDRRAHWNKIYTNNEPQSVSWYQPRPDSSLSFILGAHLANDAAIIDVGGGVSLLVDCLLDEGFSNLTVLDVSKAALERSKVRLADRAAMVNWIVDDVLNFHGMQKYQLWHDRAAFHFLIDDAERAVYVSQLKSSLQMDGHVVIAAFSNNGPQQCSGLDVQRYSADQLACVLGDEFVLQSSAEVQHKTPKGNEQAFIFCHFIYSGQRSD